jgi:glycosyltransferase involved in cell wall biosynthesis
MKISIVIPIYNVERYLTQSIDSVLGQSYSNIEVILVNDGSPDNSPQICKEYEKKSPLVKLINKTNGGLSEARNVGIMKATGDYIMFLDADDYWSGDFLSELVTFIKKYQFPDYIFYNYKYYYQKKNIFKDNNIHVSKDKLKNKSGISYLHTLLKDNKNYQWFAWAGIIKRSFLIDNQLFFEVGRNYEDVLWTPQVFLNAKSVEYFEKVVYIYRLEREGQITSKLTCENLEDNIYVSNFWYEKLKQIELNKDLKISLMKNFAVRFFVSIWYLDFLTLNEKKEIIQELQDKRYILNYRNSIISKFTKVICEIMGFSNCSKVFKRIIQLKRTLKNVI